MGAVEAAVQAAFSTKCFAFIAPSMRPGQCLMESCDRGFLAWFYRVVDVDLTASSQKLLLKVAETTYTVEPKESHNEVEPKAQKKPASYFHP